MKVWKCKQCTHCSTNKKQKKPYPLTCHRGDKATKIIEDNIECKFYCIADYLM